MADRCDEKSVMIPLGEEAETISTPENDNQQTCIRPISQASKNLKKPSHSTTKRFGTSGAKRSRAEAGQGHRMSARYYLKEVEKGNRQYLKRLRGIGPEREAARIVIENITKTVDFDNLGVIKEFQKLTGCSSACYGYGSLLVDSS